MSDWTGNGLPNYDTSAKLTGIGMSTNKVAFTDASVK